MADDAESIGRVWGRRVVLVALGLAASAVALAIQEGPGSRSAVAADATTTTTATEMELPVATNPDDAPTPAVDPSAVGGETKAVPRFRGTAAPGLKITLSARESRGEDLQYRWIQTDGPKVKLDSPDAPEVEVMVPGDAEKLAFELVAAGRGGIDRATLEVPLVLHPAAASPDVVADAGDDQVAVVGRRVTLNGVRSKPRGRAAFRWIQVEGPPVKEWNEEAWTCSFVPAAAGTCRFVLVVASDQTISKPDEVLVTVMAAPPTTAKRRSATGSASASSAIEGFARGRVEAVAGGAELAGEVAEAFEGVEARLSLYQTYDEALSELSRRIESTLPEDDGVRGDWDRLVFEPLTNRLIAAARDAGLDLTSPDGRSRPLSPTQKDRLAEVFRGIARGFRAVDSVTAEPAGAVDDGDRVAGAGPQGRG